ncbi:TetR/AcrR family transcriptional regulator [Fodinicola acaciae]|uniref:TetR/AcrR family transcriptional regulator n=1 Tax=Fodinicola acaciae TaxID=2681555 RepID=UPI0013D06717|nr:TetR/AcrR family transcriptional regulator [Fodinicola acaciae]
MSSESRRSPTGEARQRDAERSRRLILQAAVAEFSANGFAGARVSRIADRAGVNKQLISYYFGGKQGLWEAVNETWWAVARTLYPERAPIADVVTNFAKGGAGNASSIRLLVWESIGDYGTGGEPKATEMRTTWMRNHVEDLRKRQQTGELPADVDPRAIALAFFAAAAAPALFPPIAEAMGIDEPLSTESVEWYAEQLGQLVRSLARP